MHRHTYKLLCIDNISKLKRFCDDCCNVDISIDKCLEVYGDEIVPVFAKSMALILHRGPFFYIIRSQFRMEFDKNIEMSENSHKSPTLCNLK